MTKSAHDSPPAQGPADDAGVATVATTRTAGQAPVASASRNARDPLKDDLVVVRRLHRCDTADGEGGSA